MANNRLPHYWIIARKIELFVVHLRQFNLCQFRYRLFFFYAMGNLPTVLRDQFG